MANDTQHTNSIVAHLNNGWAPGPNSARQLPADGAVHPALRDQNWGVHPVSPKQPRVTGENPPQRDVGTRRSNG